MLATLFIIMGSLVLFGILIYFITTTCPTASTTEGWVDYEQLPYRNVKSGAGNSHGIRPLVFYDYPVYRRPLNFPICHLVDYPTPHCRTDSL